MNMQRRSDERSMALHKEIVKKLKSNPSLWDIPKKNLVRWKTLKDELTPAFAEWERIFRKNTKEQILSLLESDAEESIWLRSSSPFTGILNEKERKMIFESYSIRLYNRV